MSLESPNNKDDLHKLGRVALTNSSKGPRAKTTRLFVSSGNAPEIPAASLFDFSKDSSGDELPSISECAVHLELLEVFYVLRQRILTSEEIDKSVGIEPNRTTRTGHDGDTKTFKDDNFWERRQAKWPKFIEFAAVRFLVWRESLKELARTIGAAEDTLLDLSALPPLDVLMVWHSFMLNPKLMYTHCRDEPIMRLRMPWQMVHEAIDRVDWTFRQGKADEAQFTQQTGLPADLYAQFLTWLERPESPVRTIEEQKLQFFKLGNTSGSQKAPPQVKLVHVSGETWTEKYNALFLGVDNSLAIQLRDAVIRQALFVDKMNALMWIRSPAVEGTIRRGTDRYTKFLELLKRYPKQTIVPTLDIDLVWHTHQCLAGEYRLAMETMVGRFINHDDTIVKEKLGDGFGNTRKYFRMRFGKEYKICGCWDCEALLSGLEDAAVGGEGAVDMASIAQKAKRDVSYYRAVEVALRKNDRIPSPQEFV